MQFIEKIIEKIKDYYFLEFELLTNKEKFKKASISIMAVIIVICAISALVS